LNGGFGIGQAFFVSRKRKGLTARVLNLRVNHLQMGGSVRNKQTTTSLRISGFYGSVPSVVASLQAIVENSGEIMLVVMQEGASEPQIQAVNRSSGWNGFHGPTVSTGVLHNRSRRKWGTRVDDFDPIDFEVLGRCQGVSIASSSPYKTGQPGNFRPGGDRGSRFGDV